MDKKWYDNEISMGIMKRKYLYEGELLKILFLE